MSRSVPSMTSSGVRRAALGVGVLGVPALHRGHGAVQVVLALGVHGPARVAAHQLPHAGLHEDLADGHARRAQPDHQDREVLHALVDDLQRVEQGGQHDHRGAVLVVVEDGDVELLLEPVLDLEAARAPRCPPG